MSIRLFLTLLFCSGIVRAASYPVLTYSTYLRDGFTPNAIATDPAGNVYLGGTGVIDPAGPVTGAMVVKLSSQTNQYFYVSFLNGQPSQAVNAIAADSQGNAYLAGSYTSTQGTQQAFVTKLDSNGNTLFSVTPGGGVAASAAAIAVTAGGQVLVSGVSFAAGFPATSGAYSIPNTANHPWLLELDPTGAKTIFSATGIGGSVIALDPAGNIYVAGTTALPDYPTTPGVYEPVFPSFTVCTSFLCQIGAQGMNQYVSKIDPAGSTIIYSTALTGSGTGTTNTGLAVDSSGNAYVTGFAGAGYPYTVTAPVIGGKLYGSTATFAGLPFLSKLDPAGRTLLYSVPIGGSGVQVESSGTAYAGGSIGSTVIGSSYSVDGSVLPALSSVPAQCLPNQLLSTNAGYVAQVDASGNLLGAQYLGGSSLTVSSVALSGSTLWVAGATGDPNVPYTPNAPIPSYVSPRLTKGAYLGAVDFSQPQPPAGTPQIACIVDSASLGPTGPVERYQLITVFGSNLGSATGLAATNSTTTSLGGVQATFNGMAAPLLYVSSTQVNAAVPLVPQRQQYSSLQISSAGAVSSMRAVPLVLASPTLFLNVPMSLPETGSTPGYVAVALNADGSLNSSANPAQLGSTVSVFVNGLIPDPQVTEGSLQMFAEGFTVLAVEPSTPFVEQVSLQLPSALSTADSFSCPPNQAPLCSLGFSLYYGIGGLDLAPVAAGRQGTGWIWVNR
jgi:uncharacterized protein (TIGR03437 family)